MNFAFITDELPRPGVAGHLTFNHAVVSWLRDQGHEVTILLVRPRLRLPVERYDMATVAGPGLMVWGGRVIVRAPRAAAQILTRYILALLPARLATGLRRRGRAASYGLVDAVLGAFITPAQAAWCARRLEGRKPDAILVDTMFRAAVLNEPSLAGINSIIIAHDVFHRRHKALTAAGYRVHPAVLTRETEATQLRAARAIAAIQPDEANIIRAMCPDRDVCVAPMPALARPRPAGMTRRPERLIFIGSDSLPNLDGLRWFFAEIWPRLQTWRNTVTLDLVGDCGRAFHKPPEGVNRLGRVKDIGPPMHQASLAISPLRTGSGLKIKVLDYARHGLVTVATPVSLEGFAADRHAPFIAAADPVAFAVAVAAQLRRPDPDVAERHSIGYVERHYGPQTCFAGLADALKLTARLEA